MAEEDPVFVLEASQDESSPALVWHQVSDSSSGLSHSMAVHVDGSVLDEMALTELSDTLRGHSTVSSLHIRNYAEWNASLAQLIVPALKHNSSLQWLIIEDCNEDFIHALSVGLFCNRSIESLQLRGMHVGCLGFLLRNCLLLTDLRLEYCVLDASSAQRLGQGLVSNTTLHHLDCTGCGLDDIAVSALAVGVASSHVQRLCLDFNAVGDQGAMALANALHGNSHLQDVSFYSNRIQATGAQHLARALQHNTVLQLLNLSFNQVGDDGMIVLCQSLLHNTSLQVLMVQSNNISAEGWTAVAVDYLPSLHVHEWHVGLILDDAIATKLIQAVQLNVYITTWNMERPLEEDDEDDPLDFYLRLNRAGRYLLLLSQPQKQVPAALWPHVLAQSKDRLDVLYYLLRHQPHLLCAEEPARPPPRSWLWRWAPWKKTRKRS